MDVSENSGTPKSSILIGFSIINHPFWGTPIFGKHPYIMITIMITISGMFSGITFFLVSWMINPSCAAWDDHMSPTWANFIATNQFPPLGNSSKSLVREVVPVSALNSGNLGLAVICPEFSTRWIQKIVLVHNLHQPDTIYHMSVFFWYQPKKSTMMATVSGSPFF